MNVGELFITLGLKGGDKTSKELSGVKNTLGQVSTSALAVKAAIIGVVYGLERIMSSSMATGAGLANFGSLTDLSVKKLQQWQYAGRQAGVAADDMTNSVKSVQATMAKMLMGEGAPKGMSQLERLTGFDRSKAQDTFYVMGKLTELSTKLPKGAIGVDMMKSFGLSENVIQAMKRGVFNERMLSAAPIYSDREVKNLSKISIAWDNLQEKFKMSIGKLTAKEGLTIMKDIEKASDSVLKLVDSFVKLDKQVHVIQGIGKIFEGWSMIFDGMASAVKSVSEFTEEMTSGDQKKKDKALNDSWSWMKEQWNAVGEMTASGLEAVGVPQSITRSQIEVPAPKVNFDRLTDLNVRPRVQETPFARGQSSQMINVKQDLHFNHDGTDPRKIQDAHKKSVQDAHRQIQQRQVN